MNRSVELLREAGTAEWSLPSLERRTNSDYESSDSDDDGDGGSSDGDDGGSFEGNNPESSMPDNDDVLSNASLQSLPLTEGVGGPAESPLHLEPGWFVVFPMELSNPISLSVGLLLSVDYSAGSGGEVDVHLYTPSRTRKGRRSKYGKGMWSPEFVMEGNRRIPSKGTESVASACFTFRGLLQSGKLPTAVWAAVEDSVPTSSLEEEESNDNADGEGDEGEGEEGEEGEESEVGSEGGGGAGGPAHSHRRSTSSLTPPAPRPPVPAAPEGPVGAGSPAHSHTPGTSSPTPPTPCPPAPAASVPAPSANVRLTLAHFRPRRGQQIMDR